jgi:hypothetical protein
VAIDLDKECFFIAPIGEEGSAVRKRSDGVRDLIVKEAAAEHGLEARRADEFGEPGEITSQIVHHCLNAKMCVADLTEGNPNVYYELSVRHGKQLPVVLIAETGTKLPFDVGKSRVIFFEHDDYSSGIRAREEAKVQIAAALEHGLPAENPISNGMRLAELQGGGGAEQALALVMERLERLSATTADVDARLQKAEQRDAVERAYRNRLAHPTSSPLDKYAYLTGFARDREEELREAADEEVVRDEMGGTE